MAEWVNVVQRGRGRTVLLDARLARHLVAQGSFEYAAAQPSDEPVVAPPARKKAGKAEPKKRTYKRRDLTAEP